MPQMTTVYVVLWLAGLYPLGVALWANRRTSLLHAVAWALIAWLAWAWALLMGDAETPGLDPARYVALTLTGATGIAVLGARRPFALAWNFAVAGLMCVTLLPLVESLVIGTHPVDLLRVGFLSATLGVGVLNFLPTRSGPAVALLAIGCAGQLIMLFDPGALPNGAQQLAHLNLLLAPWLAWSCWLTRPSNSAFDRAWLDFRDRIGLFWAQRVRDQFNRAAANAGWPVHLTWRGLHRTVANQAIAPADQDAMLHTLHAALQRFMEPMAAGRRNCRQD